MIKLSVIMSTYNENKMELNKSINSILGQTFKNFEVIIIDDNPKFRALRDTLIKYKHLDNRIKLIFNKRNIGQALSRNEGIQLAKGKYIAIVDADDVSYKDRFLKQLNFLNKYNLDFVFSNNRLINENGKIINKSCFINHIINNQHIIRYLFAHYCNFSTQSTWLLKQSIYSKLKGYRNVEYAEDFDFILRSLIYGYKLGYQPDVLLDKIDRINSDSNRHELNQFISFIILQKYIKKNKFKKIAGLNFIHDMRLKFINLKSIDRFDKFLINGRNVKYHFSLINLIKLILSMIKSTNAIRFIIKKVKNNIMRFIIYKYM